ncbi:MAG: GIY-YIG nuclease family protein [Ferruginibacter sp.]
MFYRYIIYSASSDKYYIGSCENLDARIQQHNAGRNISTKHGIPWVIKYSEEFPTRMDAMKREKEIKNKKSRKYIEWLISSVG